MIKFDWGSNSPQKVTKEFWVELSKVDTMGIDNPILAFMLSSDETAPRVVTKIEIKTPVFGEPRINLYGTEYKWGWECEDTMAWYERSGSETFSDLEVCGPDYLDCYTYAGSTQYVSLPDSIKERIAYTSEVRAYVLKEMKEISFGIVATLHHMRGSIENEESAYGNIMRGSEEAKYSLFESNDVLKSKCEVLEELMNYNALPDTWSIETLVWNAETELENNGSVSCYPDDGEGLDLHDVTLEEFNKVQQSIALTTLDEVIELCRKYCIESFQYDPYNGEETLEYTPLTTDS